MIKSLLGVFFFSFTNGLNLVPKDMDHKFSSFENEEKIIKNNPNKLNNSNSFGVYQSLLNFEIGINGVEFTFNHIDFLNAVNSLDILDLTNLKNFDNPSYLFSFYGVGNLASAYIKSNSASSFQEISGFTIRWYPLNNNISIYNENVVELTVDNYVYEYYLSSDNIIFNYSRNVVGTNFFSTYSIRGNFNANDTLKVAIGFSYWSDNDNAYIHNVSEVYDFSDSLNVLCHSHSYNTYQVYKRNYFNYLSFLNDCLPITYVEYSLLNSYNLSKFYSGGMWSKFGVYDLSLFSPLPSGSFSYSEKLAYLNDIAFANVWNSKNAFYVNGNIYNQLCLHYHGITQDSTEFVYVDDSGDIVDYMFLNNTAATERYVYIDYVYATYVDNNGVIPSRSIILFETPVVKGKNQANVSVSGYLAYKQILSDNIYQFGLLFNGSGFSKTTNGRNYTAVDILGLSYYSTFVDTGDIGNGLDLINTAFVSLSGLLYINILPGITLGILVFLPLIAGIIVLVWKALSK